MSVSRGISKSSLTVALYRSFPSPVTAMAGTTALGLSRGLRTRPIRNRPRTPRWGQGRTQTRSYAFDIRRTSFTSSLTTCDFVSQQPAPPAPGSRPAPPLADKHPAPVTDLTSHRLLRTRMLGGVINEYRYAA